MRPLRSPKLLVATAAMTLAITSFAGASSAAPPKAAERGSVVGLARAGFRVLQARTFEAADGHLYTTADLEVDGKVIRGVTAPGGRLGDRWESVESFPPIQAGDDAAAHDESEHDAEGPQGAEAFRLQTGDAAGSTMASDATAGSSSSYATAGFSTLYGYGWCSRLLDAPYRINTARAPGGAVDAVRAGFNVWTNHASSWMSFAYRGGTSIAKASRDDGVNAVFFSYTPESILGRTWTYGTGRFLNGFDMQLNSKYRLTVGGSGYDLQSLVGHEAGHAAGFGHTSSGGNLMYGAGQAPGQISRALGSQDRAGLVSLYPYGDLRAAVVSSSAPSSLATGRTGTMSVTFENRGRTPWGGARFPALRVRTSSGTASPFADGSWISASQPASTDVPICQGGRITVAWTMRAPSVLKTYTPTFVPVAGPTTKPRWLTGATVQRTISVTGLTGGGDDGGGGGDDDGGCFLFFCW